MLAWLHDWYVTIRYASPLTRDGRSLRRSVREFDGSLAGYVEVPRPGGDA